MQWQNRYLMNGDTVFCIAPVLLHRGGRQGGLPKGERGERAVALPQSDACAHRSCVAAQGLGAGRGRRG